jgi:type VI secretion system protein ImpL
MAKLPAFATHRLTWRVIGALLLGIIIWFVGPLIAIGSVRPLGNDIVRLILSILPLALVGLFWWLEKRQAAKKNAALVDALAAPRAGQKDMQEVESKLLEALTMLRTMKIGKQRAYLYELPWYAIIGPSGAGKTTALLNSGLDFPTAVAGDYRALRGQPNTPNCDWWFTDQAVLIDTAGRFVTQEDQAADAEGWRGFLGLLQKHRPLQPLNGILVALPAPALADRALLDSHIGHIRARLSEVTQTLGQDLPVYLLLTKADLLVGFREFFARGTEGEANQVLGSTAPDPAVEPHVAIGEISAGFDALIDSLGGRVVDRVQMEPQQPLRAQLAGFPQQVASLRKPLARLLGALTQQSRFEPAARIRGVYLTSGTQTGNPVDRILMSIGMPPMSRRTGSGPGAASS